MAYVNELLRPDYAGFVFYRTQSADRSTAEMMQRHAGNSLRHKIQAVGVFRQCSAPEEVATLYQKNGLIELAQLHGAETAEDIRRLRRDPATDTR